MRDLEIKLSDGSIAKIQNNKFRLSEANGAIIREANVVSAFPETEIFSTQRIPKVFTQESIKQAQERNKLERQNKSDRR